MFGCNGGLDVEPFSTNFCRIDERISEHRRLGSRFSVGSRDGLGFVMEDKVRNFGGGSFSWLGIVGLGFSELVVVIGFPQRSPKI